MLLNQVKPHRMLDRQGGWTNVSHMHSGVMYVTIFLLNFTG